MRFRINTNALAEILLRPVLTQEDKDYQNHLLNDFKFDSEWCYPIIDRDRGPKQPEGSSDAQI